MAEQAYAYVTLIPVAKGFQREIANQLGGAEKIGEKVGKDFSGGFKQEADKLANGIIASFAAVAAGAGLLIKSSIGEASELTESLNAVAVAYGESSEAIIKLGEDAAGRLGVTQSAFNASAVRFSAFAERIVGASGNVAGFIDTITTRASDFASVFNIDVAEALRVFQSGLAGEAEPLKRFGINLLDSEVQAFALANGIGEVGRQLTETEKVQARYGLLLQSTAKTQGDFANTSDGLANSQRILQAEFKDLQAELGTALLPVMATLINQVKDSLLPLFEEFGDWLRSPEGVEAIRELGEAFKDGLQNIIDVTEALLDNYDIIVDVVKFVGLATAAYKLYSIQLGIATTLQLGFNTAVKANPYILAATALVALTAAAIAFKGEVDDGIYSVEESTEKIGVLETEMDNLAVAYQNGAIELEAYESQAAGLRQEIDKLTVSTQESIGELNRFQQLRTKSTLARANEAWANSWVLRGQAYLDSLETDVVTTTTSAVVDTDMTEAAKQLIEDTRKDFKDRRNEFRQEIKEIQRNNALDQLDIARDYEESVANATSRFNDTSLEITERYNERIATANRRRDEGLAAALQDHNGRIAEIQDQFAKKQADIIQQSMNRLRDSYRNAVQINVASIFDSDQIAGSIDGTIETMRNKLLDSRQLLANAASLSAAGFSQTFIEQVVSAGTDVGNEMAEAILNSSPEQQAEMQMLFSEIEDEASHGMDSLSETIYEKNGLATDALKDLYAQTEQELIDSIERQNFAYQEAMAAVQEEFNESLVAAEIMRTNAMQKAQDALDQAILEAKTRRDNALREAEEQLQEALLKANEDFNKDLERIQEAFNKKIADMKGKIRGLNSDIANLVAGVGAAQSAAASRISGLQGRLTELQLVPFADGGLVTGPTAALIGEAGPEVVIPLDRFESMMGGSQPAVNYFAAPNQSLDAEQELFQAMKRAKVVVGW